MYLVIKKEYKTGRITLRSLDQKVKLIVVDKELTVGQLVSHTKLVAIVEQMKKQGFLSN